jgi:hypothetical protein
MRTFEDIRGHYCNINTLAFGGGGIMTNFEGVKKQLYKITSIHSCDMFSIDMSKIGNVGTMRKGSGFKTIRWSKHDYHPCSHYNYYHGMFTDTNGTETYYHAVMLMRVK